MGAIVDQLHAISEKGGIVSNLRKVCFGSYISPRPDDFIFT
jgi:hypothetical protein